MDQEFTTEQKNQLVTWAEQRDALLLEISNLRVAEETLQKANKALAESNTNIENRMIEIRGRIEELKIKESELPPVISREVATLQSQKSTLQAEVADLKKLIDVLSVQKTSLEIDIAAALNTLNIVKGETLLLDKVVGRVTQVSQDNTSRIDSLVTNLATSLEEIIEVNRKNVFETNIVIDKLPKMLMEAQKHGLIKNRESIIKK